VNLFGLDVRDSDVPAFVSAARSVFPWLALAWLAALLRVRRPGWLLLGVLGANVWVWGTTNYPLQRVYALGPSPDRVGNVALCQVVAASGSPLETVQVGQLHFEPLWGALVAVLSGFDPHRVLALYPYLSLATVLGFSVALYLGLAPDRAGPGDEEGSASPWARAMAVGFATLLCSSPLDFTGVYRVPWAMTFLLKPNHALALVLFPLLLRAFAGIRTWGGRIGVGLLLHLMGWAFVLHMAYTALGLLLFALLGLVQRRPEARRDAVDVAVVLGINLVVVSPYLYMLFVGYPFLDPSPRMTIHPTSAHLLETTLRHPAVFALGVWGLVVLYRRQDRLGRVLFSQAVTAHLIWAGYLFLSLLQLARERDEIYYWTRFLTAACAGIGAWDAARRATEWTGLRLTPPARAAAVAALALPWSLPAWWDPIRMDSYFPGSVTPIPDVIRQPSDFLRSQTDPSDVVGGDRDYARYVAALGARRVLLANTFHAPRDVLARVELEERLVRGGHLEAARSAARRYRLRYLVVTPALLSAYPDVRLSDLERREDLDRVFFTGNPRGDYVAIFRLK
jgi:hypothetical protein